MMILNTVKYANAENTIVIFDNGSIVADAPEIKQWVLDGGTIEAYKTNQELFNKAVTDKETEIKNSFLEAEVLPVVVTTAQGDVSFHGGRSSAQALDGKQRTTEKSKALNIIPTDDVKFFDVANVTYTFTMADAILVVLAVSNRYETDLYTYKERINAIKAVVFDGSTEVKALASIDAVKAITW